MTVLENLKPKLLNRVMDLVSAAGLDVSDWANYEGSEPASNPKYCYEWCYLGQDLIVMNLWFGLMREAGNGTIQYSLNARETANRTTDGNRAKRAGCLDIALQIAKNKNVPVRVIICDGARFDIDIPGSKSSKVKAREIDALAWKVIAYDQASGEALLQRSSSELLTGQPWTARELEAAVADYFHMLRLELLGQTYNKSAHRRELQKLLMGRSEGSIEMKHQNISAVLQELGVMPLSGYKGLPNYQKVLVDSVTKQLAADSLLDKAALAAVEQAADVPVGFSFNKFFVDRPLRKPTHVKDELKEWIQKSPVKRDYLERESRNRALGKAGEQLALEYESYRLHQLGKKTLAARIEHTSETKGDGCGYDILSFESDGRERFIEVKTTAFSESTPFYISNNEVSFSKSFSDQFHLYRIYDFRREPQMFSVPGSVAVTCLLDPISFRASIL